LSPEQLRNVSGLGKKKQKQILEFRQHLIGRGIKPKAAARASPRSAGASGCAAQPLASP
jgi:hypothetical protein